MSLYVKALEEMRDLLASQKAEIINAALREKRALTPDDQSKSDNLDTALVDADKRLQAARQHEQREADIEASLTQGRKGAGTEERSDFDKFIRESRAGDGFDLQFRASDIERRAMSATGGTGKASVASTLWEYAVEASEILAYAQVMSTADGNTIPMPKATVHAEPGATDIPANDPIPEDDSTITTVDLSVAKRGYLTFVPNELLQDATFDVEGYIARNAGRALGLNVAQAAVAAAIAGFTTQGAVTPAGVLTGLGAQNEVGQGSDLLVDLFHSVIAPYRTSASAAWGVADLTAAVLRKLKTSTGDLVWQDGLTAGNPSVVLGKPVFIAPGFDTFAASKKPIFFGDWQALVVRIAGGLRFERSAEAGFKNDQTAFKAIVRRGAVALDPNAVKFLATPAV
ncbi:phage major capsid protein [Occultella gossypii]|uniref:Phage major capsid protein n=1 Tax=Occultella gossypii TaxID=2800820 RepID=A0ABS7SA99_9MICO|nr:phage major capsid protein [Occultella gossypii]MBZ2197269.1 phage major capsid protein [Occultella gossypii]